MFKGNLFHCIKIKKIFPNSLIVIYYVLNNNFFYTQLEFVFVPQKDSYISLLSFLTSEKFWYLSRTIFQALLFFFIREILISFTSSFFESDFVFLIIVISHFIYRKKNYEKLFICFKNNFSIWVTWIFHESLKISIIF